MKTNVLYIAALIYLGFLLSKFIYNVICYVAKNRRVQKVAVIGNNKTSARLINHLKSKKNIDFCGTLDHEEDMFCKESEMLPQRLLKQINKVSKKGVKTLYVSVEPSRMADIAVFVSAVEEHFIRVKIIPDLGLMGLYHLSYMDEQFATISLRNEPLADQANRIKKRIVDLAISSLAIVFVLSWLYPLIGILIKLQSKGPVLFKQLRSGRDDESFYCYKFRSMHMNGECDSIQASRSDQRITPIGKFLRSSSLDELPQFINVFLGDMSVVGPRPHMIKHTEHYKSLINQFMVRHFLKPGITGWAQVNGCRGETRRKEDMERRIQHDIWYLENWSPMLDMKIVFLTIMFVLKGDENAF